MLDCELCADIASSNLGHSGIETTGHKVSLLIPHISETTLGSGHLENVYPHGALSEIVDVNPSVLFPLAMMIAAS